MYVGAVFAANMTCSDTLCSVQFATSAIYFGVDPLSRRSLLMHVGDATQPAFILSSSRSALAREQGVVMTALNGGCTGVLHLANLQVGFRRQRAIDSSSPRA